MSTISNFSQPAIFTEVSTPLDPESGFLKVYAKSGVLCSIANGQSEQSYLTSGSAGSTYLPLAGGTLTNPSAAAVPLTVVGATSQSASLTEWKNSAGTVGLYVKPDNGGQFLSGASTLYRSTFGAGNFAVIGYLGSSEFQFYTYSNTSWGFGAGTSYALTAYRSVYLSTSSGLHGVHIPPSNNPQAAWDVHAAVDSVVLRAKMLSGQTSHAFTVVDSADNVLSAITATGGFLTNDIVIRNGTTPTEFNLHNTYTSTTSFEAFRIKNVAGNNCLIGTACGSAGGTSRGMSFGKWNAAGTFAASLSFGVTGGGESIGSWGFAKPGSSGSGLTFNAARGVFAGAGLSQYNTEAYTSDGLELPDRENANGFSILTGRGAGNGNGGNITFDFGRGAGTGVNGKLILLPDASSSSGTLSTILDVHGTTSLAGDLLFTDATYDIGKSGATRPRDGFFSRNLTVGNTATLGTTTVNSTGLVRFANTSAGTPHISNLYSPNSVGFNFGESTINATYAGANFFTLQLAATHLLRDSIRFYTVYGGYTPVTVRHGSSPTVDMQKWENSAGTTLSAITATGGLLTNDIVVRNGTTATQLDVNETYTSSTSFGTLRVKANAGAAYQIGSAIGSAGGTNRAITFGHWNAAGTFTSTVTVGKLDTATLTVQQSFGQYNLASAIAVFSPYGGNNPVTISWNGTLSSNSFLLSNYGAVFYFTDGVGTIGQTANSGYPGGTRYSPFISAYDDLELIHAPTRAITIGKAFSSTPATSRLLAQSGMGANTAGANLEVGAGKSTGTGLGGSLIFQTAPAGSSGSSANSLVTRLTIDSAGTSTFAGDLLFTDATYDIGKSGATRPRDGFFSRDLTAGREITISSPSSTYAMLQTWKSGGTTRAYMRDDGYCVAGIFDATSYISTGGAVVCGGLIMGGSVTVLNRVGQIENGNTTLQSNVAIELRPAASSNLTAILNSTNAQTFRLYNTYTSATSFENLQFKANAGAAYQIGSAIGSAGGTNRAITFGHWNTGGSFTSSLSIDTTANQVQIGTIKAGYNTSFSTGVYGINLNNGTPNCTIWSGDSSAFGSSFSGYNVFMVGNDVGVLSGYGIGSYPKFIYSNGSSLSIPQICIGNASGFSGLDLSFGTTGTPSDGEYTVTSGYGANKFGASMWLMGGRSTGNGAGGSVYIGSSTTGSSGSTRNSNFIIAQFSPFFISFNQSIASSGSPTAFTITGAAHTTLTASTEATDVNFNLARTVQFAAGTLTTQRAFRVQAPTYAFASASTITTASTLSISGAPVAGTNTTITNAYALNVESGSSLFGGAVVAPAGYIWNTNLFGFVFSGSTISGTNGFVKLFGGTTPMAIYTSNQPAMTFGTGFPIVNSLQFKATLDTSITTDLVLIRDAANTLAQRNSTNAQIFRVYNTYTSSTSNEFLQIRGVASANFEIGPENGSAGGTLRGLTIGGYSGGSSTITPWLTFDNAGKASMIGPLVLGTGTTGKFCANTSATSGTTGTTRIIQITPHDEGGTASIGLDLIPGTTSTALPSIRMFSANNGGILYGFQIGTGPANLAVDTWHIASTVVGDSTEESYPISFTVSTVADGRFPALYIQNNGIIRPGRAIHWETELIGTPAGTTRTINLNLQNHQTLALTSATGTVTATLTVPTNGSAAGTIIIQQHASAAKDITWAVSSGSIKWFGTEPDWAADPTSSYRLVTWRWNGSIMFLSTLDVAT